MLKNKYFFIIILLISMISINFLLFFEPIFNFETRDKHRDDFFKLDQIRTSASEIDIINPENKTYTEPMSGFYPATYGFENDENGMVPAEWVDSKEDPLMLNEIIAELNGHKKVLHMDKGNTFGDNNNMVNYFKSVQQYGTIEFWARTTDVSKESSWHLKSGTFNQYSIAGIAMMDNTFKIKNSTSWYSVPYTANNSKWYHIKIQFECGMGNHYGLAQYKWRLFVNNTQFGDYQMISSHSNVSHILLHQNWLYDNFHTYIDALAYSWDINYNIGDNLNEGLLLSYENSTALEWKGYSLDGSANKTILGNSTILFPSEGIHSIQVFGNDSIGTNYGSDARYFTVGTIAGEITIITPENKTYTEPMSGFYPATYGFENDENGMVPAEWEDQKEDPLMVNEIIGELNGHKKILHMDKGNTYGTSNNIVQYFKSVQQYGAIEFWVRTTDVSKESSWHLKSGTYNQYSIAGIAMMDNTFKIKNSTSWYSVPYIANNNQWYHIKIQFECGTGNHYGLAQYKWRLFVNNTQFGDYQMISSHSNVSHILLHQNWQYDNFHTYIDALAYSWDINYNIGNNLNEGLLLSFENSTALEWIGFSLDGAVNRTILGNTTLTMLYDGLHTIQVFGNYSFATMCQSDTKYFSIDITPPTSVLSFVPYEGSNIVIPSTEFTISSDDGMGSGVSIIRYKINDSSWILYTAPFTLSSFDYGIYLITYQAIDNVGHIETEKTQIINLIEEPSEPSEPMIHGYSIWILIGIVSVTSLIVIRRRIKK